MSQPFTTAQIFTGYEGRYVKLADSIRSFKEILDGKHDDLPEAAFFMVIKIYFCLFGLFVW